MITVVMVLFMVIKVLMVIFNRPENTNSYG